MPVRIHVKNFQSIQEATVDVDGFTVVTGSNNTGKALVHGTKVATPAGWIPVEEIKIGQQVLAGDGSPTEVLGVYPQGSRETCRITFDDGRQITTDYEHLWSVSLGRERFPENASRPQRWSTLSTAEILERTGPTPKRHMRPAIPMAGAAQFTQSKLPLDPYVMGVLLGGGILRGTSIYLDIPYGVVSLVRPLLSSDDNLEETDHGYFLESRGVSKTLSDLGLLGCLNHKKWVPEIYQLGNPQQRLALLHGLMDVRGTVGRRGHGEFTTRSEDLAEAVIQLVWSFGGTSRVKRSGNGLLTVTIRLSGLPAFRLPNKAKAEVAPKERLQPVMVSFEARGLAECTCIEVAHPSSLFQVEGHLVTHNTALLRAAKGVFQNTPGSAFIREGKTSCEVSVDFGDQKVTWSKGTGKRDRPTYIVNDGDPIHPGQAVPEEVSALGVIPIQAGGQEIWPTIAPQFTGQIFLLDKPGSAVAEAVADVERVGQLNQALRDSESDKRHASAELKVRQADLVRQEAELSSFDGLDAAVDLVSSLESERVTVLRLERGVAGLTDIQTRLGKSQAQVQELVPIAGVSVPNAQISKEISKSLEEIQALKGLLRRYTQAQGVISFLAPVDTISLPKAEVVQAIHASHKNLLRMEDLLSRLAASQTAVSVMGPLVDCKIPEAGDLRALSESLRALTDLQGRYVRAQSEVARLQALGSVDLSEAMGTSSKLSKALGTLKGYQARLRAGRSRVKELEVDLASAETAYQDAKEKALSELADLGQCPTCGAETHKKG